MLGASRRHALSRSVHDGEDCGWVDYVQWTGPGPDPDPNVLPTEWDELSYTYDPGGRRIEKAYDGQTVVKYLYDGDHCIAEYDGNNELLRKYIYGPGIDQPICMIDVEDSNAVYYYHYDGLGSVVALSDAAGDTVQLYEYTVFGQVAAEDPNHPNPFLFTARRFDTETGLYYYRARYYNPYIGRFLQTDPIGYGDGMNMYAYCRNSPLRFTDPLGLMTKEASEASKANVIEIFYSDNVGFIQLCGEWTYTGLLDHFRVSACEDILTRDITVPYVTLRIHTVVPGDSSAFIGPETMNPFKQGTAKWLGTDPQDEEIQFLLGVIYYDLPNAKSEGLADGGSELGGVLLPPETPMVLPTWPGTLIGNVIDTFLPWCTGGLCTPAKMGEETDKEILKEIEEEKRKARNARIWHNFWSLRLTVGYY